MRNAYDIYIVGLGGQGILTIGDLLAQAALSKGLHVNFYPTKGMSQRGGFVQGQLRFGRDKVGPSLPPQGADLVVAMERSEALKGLRFAKPGCDFLLYDDVWPTTAVFTGKAKYPSLEQVVTEISRAGVKPYCLNNASLPVIDGVPAYANMFILGALLAKTTLKEIFSADEIISVITYFWPKGAAANIAAVQAGYAADIQAL